MAKKITQKFKAPKAKITRSKMHETKAIKFPKAKVPKALPKNIIGKATNVFKGTGYKVKIK